MKLRTILGAAVISALLTSALQGGAPDGASAERGGGGGAGFSMHSRDAAGNGSTLVDDGNGCMIMSTPSGSLSSGC